MSISKSLSRNLLFSLMGILFVTSILTLTVNAGGKGQLRIEPHAYDEPDPTILTSVPATFTVSVVEHTATDPYLLLVISEDCYDGLDGNTITVTWNWDLYIPSWGFDQTDFVWIDKGWVPPEEAFDCKLYQARSLRDHLGVPEDEGIWYTYAPIPVADIKKGDEYEFTIDIPTEPVRMLVYAFSDCVKVPPTRPGFVIPEVPLGVAMTLIAMMAALIARGKFKLFLHS